jgi:hypothetical protein
MESQMLDEANREFLNNLVTVLRYGLYVVGVVIVLGALGFAVSWLWERLTFRKHDEREVRRRMRDLGY